ncbi:hypothetical protein P8936_09685 [Edaphobacter paludis]|uniref:Molecular chaperone DjlA n=1 Tax=Edaphobacter paludis TaxID=3035702 RepID=A0AAU7CV17_9BACT
MNRMGIGVAIVIAIGPAMGAAIGVVLGLAMNRAQRYLNYLRACPETMGLGAT